MTEGMKRGSSSQIDWLREAKDYHKDVKLVTLVYLYTLRVTKNT